MSEDLQKAVVEPDEGRRERERENKQQDSATSSSGISVASSVRVDPAHVATAISATGSNDKTAADSQLNWFQRLRRSDALVVWGVALALFVDYLLLTAVVPIVPTLIEDEQVVGLLFSSKAIVQVIAAPLVGWISDRIGRMVPLQVGNLIIIGSSLLFAYGDSVLMLGIARGIQGIGSACTATAGFALIAERLPDDIKRGKAMGIIMTGLAMGVTLGPPIGGALYDLGNQNRLVPFGFIAALTLVEGILLLLSKDNRHKLGNSDPQITSEKEANKGTRSREISSSQDSSKSDRVASRTNTDDETTGLLSERTSLLSDGNRRNSRHSDHSTGSNSDKDIASFDDNNNSNNNMNSTGDDEARINLSSGSSSSSSSSSSVDNNDVEPSAPSLSPTPLPKARAASELKMLLRLLQDPRIAVLAAGLMTINGCIAFMEPSLPRFWKDVGVAESASLAGGIFVTVSVAYAIASPLTSVISKYIGRWSCILIGLVLMTISLPLLALAKSIATTVPVLLFAGIAIGMGGAAGLPLLSSITDEVASRDEESGAESYGKSFAIGDMACNIGFIIGPIAGSSLFATFGFFIACVAIAGINLLVAPFTLACAVYERRRHGTWRRVDSTADASQGYSSLA